MTLKKPKIALITVLTDDVDRLKNFYNKVLGFPIQSDLDKYVEFNSKGVRFALCKRSVMKEATGNRDYDNQPRGHQFELAFPVDSPEEVDSAYDHIITNGAKAVKNPSNMPWGQRTAFFADPDGNIHEIFADLE